MLVEIIVVDTSSNKDTALLVGEMKRDLSGQMNFVYKNVGYVKGTFSSYKETLVNGRKINCRAF